MPTRNINLTDYLDRFVAKEVASGRYGNASEVIRESLRLLDRKKKTDQAKMKWLKQAGQEAIDSLDRGEGIEFSSVDELDAYMESVWLKAAAESSNRRKRA